MRVNWKAWTGRLAKIRVQKTQLHPPRPALATAEQQDALLQDIQTAHREWVCAHHRLDQALGFDEVDYAIFALETAEKRYSMLLKQAKAMRLSARSFRPNEALASKRSMEG